MTTQELYLARLQRIDAAVACREPDRVPLMPFARAYPYVRQGHSMAEAMNSAALAAEDMKRFVLDFEPDMVISYTASLAGAGPVMEESGIAYLEWPGHTGGPLKENGIMQMIEHPTMGEDDYEELAEDPAAFLPGGVIPSPLSQSYGETAAAFAADMEAQGFPMAFAAATAPAYDVLSMCRGTLDMMMDLYAQDEEVTAALEALCPLTIDYAVKQAQQNKGRFVYVPMRNGMEDYLGIDLFEEFYFPTLQKLTEGLLSHGLTPILYAEGGYNSRLELLSELPEGVVFHLDSVNMQEAKKTVGKNHCLSGGFYAYDLVHSDPEHIEMFLKWVLDTVAVDGGYIFDFGDKLDEATPENIETMFRVLREYGKY